MVLSYCRFHDSTAARVGGPQRTVVRVVDYNIAVVLHDEFTCRRMDAGCPSGRVAPIVYDQVAVVLKARSVGGRSVGSRAPQRRAVVHVKHQVAVVLVHEPESAVGGFGVLALVYVVSQVEPVAQIIGSSAGAATIVAAPRAATASATAVVAAATRTAAGGPNHCTAGIPDLEVSGNLQDELVAVRARP